MKKNLTFLLLPMFFSACNQTPVPQTTCPVIACSDIFVYYTLRFVDKNNFPVGVADYSVIDLRTNTHIVSKPLPLAFGIYNIVDDSDKKLLSVKGDSLQITATDTVVNQTKTIFFVVSGGTCACHINKISGPDTVKFN